LWYRKGGYQISGNEMKMLAESEKDIKTIAAQMQKPDCRMSITFIDNELNKEESK
jgi:hypothetical protein